MKINGHLDIAFGDGGIVEPPTDNAVQNESEPHEPASEESSTKLGTPAETSSNQLTAELQNHGRKHSKSCLVL